MSFTTLANKESLTNTIKSLKGKDYEVVVVSNKEDALTEIKQRIPRGSSVMNGTSTTLQQIGYMDYLARGEHGWADLHSQVNAEDDKQKRGELRRQSLLSEYYLGSVHALVENGEFIVASNTGSQLPHIVYSSPHLLFVVSTKKIVPTMAAAFKRLEEYVIPLEDQRMQKMYSMGTGLSKIVIFKAEAKMSARKITFILVEEDLGF